MEEEEEEGGVEGGACRQRRSGWEVPRRRDEPGRLPVPDEGVGEGGTPRETNKNCTELKYGLNKAKRSSQTVNIS